MNSLQSLPVDTITTTLMGMVAALVTISVINVYCLKKLRKLSWLASISDDPKVNKKPLVVDGTYHLILDIQSGGPSTSGGTSTIENVYMYLNQWPMHFVLVIYMCVILPGFIARMLFSKIKNGRYGVIKSEKDVVELILSVPDLYMMCKAVSKKQQEEYPSDNMWIFEIPKDLPSEAYDGDLVSNDTSITFLQNERRIVSATYQGHSIDPRTCSHMLRTLVYSCNNNWSHFKSHVASEISANEIINGKVTALEPSSRFVHCLHSGLLNSPLSPVVESSPLFALSITRQCLEDRLSIKMPHYLDLKKRGLPGFDFLYAARKSIDTHLKAHKLDVSTEPLFQNLVVHSINHYLFYRYNGGKCDFSLDGSETFMSYIRNFFFIEFWSIPKINPFDDVRLCALAKSSSTHQFYVDVYQDLVKVDRELADHVIASTCF